MDGAVIMGLLAAMNDDQMEFSTGFIIGIITAVCSSGVMYGATTASISVFGKGAGALVGIAGGCVLIALGVAVFVFTFFGMDLKRAILLGAIFTAYRIILTISIYFMSAAG